MNNDQKSGLTISDHTIRQPVPYRVPGEPEPVKPGKKAPKPMTEEEILAGRKAMLDSMGYDPAAAANEPAPEKTAEELEAERVAAETKAAEEAAAEQARKDEEARQAELEASGTHNPTAEEREAALVERTVKATTAAMKELLPKTDTAADVAPEVAALSPEDKTDLEAVAYLEANERVPAGTKSAMLAFYQKCATYREKWMKEHPGEEYNPEEKEHADVIQSWQPDVAVELLDEAREEVRVEKMVAKRLKPIEDQRQSERQNAEVAQILEKAKPAIHTAFRTSIVKLLDQAAPAVLEILKDKNGKLDLSPEAVAKLEAADPVAKEVLDAVIGQELHPVIVELEKHSSLGGRLPWDLKNPLHTHIIDEMLACEKVLAEAPAKVRIQNGKQFISIVEHAARTQEINSGSGTQAEKQAALSRLARTTWTLTTEDIKESFIDKCAKNAQKRMAQADSLVKKASGKEAPVRSKGAQPAAPVTQRTPAVAPPAKSKHIAPSTASQSDTLPAPGNQQPQAKTFGETAIATHFR